MKILLMSIKLTDGGAERVCASWASGLTKLGHDVSILSDFQTDSIYPVDSRVRLIQQCKWKSPNPLIRRIRGLGLKVNQIKTLCKNERYDAIVNVSYCDWVELKIATSLLRNRPVVIMTDHNVCERPQYVPMPKKLWISKFIVSRFFDYVTVLTKADLVAMKEHYVKNVSVLNNPLFLKPSSESILRKENIVLAMGRLDSWKVKGFDVLISAWNKVYEIHPDWKLRIVGKGSYEIIEKLKSDINVPESVELLPFTSNPTEQYEQASIFVLSSRYEGWGLVMIEAMSQGCATIACDYKGRQGEAITDGVNGLLCETDNPEALAKKINLLIEKEDLRNRLQLAAPQSVARFNEDRVAKNLEGIIQTLKYKKIKCKIK